MLSTGATERKHQRCKSTLDVARHMRIGQRINMLKKGDNFAILFQEINHRLIQPRQLFVRFIASGVVSASAVENIAAAVSTFVGRKAFFVGETKNAHHQRRIVRSKRFNSRHRDYYFCRESFRKTASSVG